MQNLALSLASKGAPFVISTRPIPKPVKGQMLVRIVATALNPLDAFMQASGYLVASWPVVCGWDAAGIVEELGEGVEGFEIGDRVMYEGDFTNDRYTFQTYGLANASTAAKIPSNLPFEQAATIPLCLSTAAIGLYGKRANENSSKRGGVGLVAPWDKGGRGKYKDEPILVTGGASSVGQFAIQLAKLSGFNPIITTASAHNKAYCEAAGATHVIDYHSTPYSELASAVASITSQPIKIIYDAIAVPDSQIACWSLLSPGGNVVVTLPPSKDIGEPGVEDKDGKFVAWVFGSVCDDTIGDVRLGETMFKVLEDMMRDGEIKPNQVEILEGGLAGIEGGLQRMLTGKVSGVKLVARLSETP